MTKKNPTYSAYGCLEDDGRTKLTPIVWKEEVNRTILLKHYPSQDTDMATEETGSATIDEPAQKLSRGRFRIAGFATRTLDRKSRARSSHSLEAEGKRVVTKAGTAETEAETMIDEPDTAVDQSRTAEPTFKETSTEISRDGTPLKANETPMTDFVMPSKASAKLSDVNFSVVKQDGDDTVSLGSRLFFRGRNDGTNADLDDICASTEEKRSISVSLSCSICQTFSLQLIHTVPFLPVSPKLPSQKDSF